MLRADDPLAGGGDTGVDGVPRFALAAGHAATAIGSSAGHDVLIRGVAVRPLEAALCDITRAYRILQTLNAIGGLLAREAAQRCLLLAARPFIRT